MSHRQSAAKRRMDVASLLKPSRLARGTRIVCLSGFGYRVCTDGPCGATGGLSVAGPECEGVMARLLSSLLLARRFDANPIRPKCLELLCPGGIAKGVAI